MKVIDNFLSEEECDFLIQYYKKHPFKESYKRTVLLRMKDTSLFHLKKSLIRYRYLKRIEKEFSLKLCFDQIVFWPPFSYKPMHKDGYALKEKDPVAASVDWTSVCYLNDDYEGGETMIEDRAIKPKKGKLTLFPSKKMEHGVSLVRDRSRYTYIAWWQEKLE